MLDGGSNDSVGVEGGVGTDWGRIQRELREEDPAVEQEATDILHRLRARVMLRKARERLGIPSRVMIGAA